MSRTPFISPWAFSVAVFLGVALTDAFKFSFEDAGSNSTRNLVQSRPQQALASSNVSFLYDPLRPPKDDCECFNCQLPKFTCGQYGECSEYDGQCKCPPGWGGLDCLTPQCGSLADGRQRFPRPEDRDCECSDGWGGPNCNVCLTNEGCAGFPLNIPDDEIGTPEMVCYQGGDVVRENHQVCNVTNPEILTQLEGRIPRVSFSCEKDNNTCLFQFWVDHKESFYCGLDKCSGSASHTHDADLIQYECQKLRCSCIPGRMLCGEAGSVDIGDFLTEEIKGPAKFSCRTGAGCRFEEDAMNQLITDVFGDPYITLQCNSGECLAESMVPGYERPAKPRNNLMIALSAAAGGVIFLFTFLGLWYVGRTSEGEGGVKLPEVENAKLISDHIPASLQFSNISYSLGTRTILDNVSGAVGSGQLLAIMGASGAGKSTLLDILAGKNKRGTISGTVLINGTVVPETHFKNIIGFVDQEDTLMSTLTVYETVLYSALLRLPREMSFEAKRFRTLETLHELGLLGIKDSRIGDTSRRSISGGEKRRVSVACELVTSPSLLFLDEPTSGLDAYNALNVTECLVALARNYNRTVVFTIHQPRSNIVALFDKLLVLAEGHTIYSGNAASCADYFSEIGKPCPVGFNIADHLIDVAMTGEKTSNSEIAPEDELPSTSTSSRNDVGEEGNKPNSDSQSLRQKTSQFFAAVTARSSREDVRIISPHVEALRRLFAQSKTASEVKQEIADAQARARADNANYSMEPSVKGHRRAGWMTQFRILSGRAFKNMYRDPALLASHYASSIIVGLICGIFFRNVNDDISGFQNRLGFFFFTLALFGFACLSSLSLFANERILFIRERSNGYYSTFTYFASKVLFDILPLRVVPPLVFGGITYGLVGLVPTVATFWRFQLALVMFNLTTASVILTISVAFSSTGVATLVGTLVMLFNLLFGGLLINAETIMPALRWLSNLSFFHSAFEALAVNELRYLHLRERKYGVDISVPSATILQLFGLKALAFWWPDISTLAIFFGTFMVTSFLLLQFYVKESR